MAVEIRSRTSTPEDVLLRASDVEKLLDQRKQWRQVIKDASAKLLDIERKLEAAEILTGKVLLDKPEGNGAIEPITMAEAAEVILDQAGRLMTPAQIKLKLAENPVFAERLETSSTYFYTMLSRLVKRGKAEKVGKRYRAPKEESASDGR